MNFSIVFPARRREDIAAIGRVGFTATAMAVIRPARDWYLALLGALAFALAAAGRDYRRHPARRPWRRWPGHIPHILAMGGSYTVLLTAFYVDNGKNLPLWDRLPTAAYWTLPALVATPKGFIAAGLSKELLQL